MLPTDTLGGTWEDAGPLADPRWNAYDQRSRTRAVSRLLRGEPRTGPALDLGCSIGAWWAFWHREGFPPPIGLDFAARHLATARRRGYVPCCADGCRLPFRRDTLGVVLCVDVLVHLPDLWDRVALCEEIARVLRPGGVAVFSVANVQGYRRGDWMHVEGSSVYLSENLCRGVFDLAGLDVERVRALQWVESVRPWMRFTPGASGIMS